VVTGREGDPASTSALGGTLRRQALDLADLAADLAADVGGTSGTSGTSPATTLADELDRVGALLQAWTTDGVEAAHRVRTLDERLRAADLVVDGTRVVEAPGPSRVEALRRLHEREHLQELLNRVTSARAKDAASLARELARSRDTLARLSVLARGR
jgi:hypothetical protein